MKRSDQRRMVRAMTKRPAFLHGLRAFILLALLALFFYGVFVRSVPAQPLATGIGTTSCVPPDGIGYMTACVPLADRGVLSPAPTTSLGGVQGVDISVWNGHVDFPALKRAGISFVAIKADQACAEDKMLVENARGARAAGLYIQTYDFVQPGLINPTTDAGCMARFDQQIGVTRKTLPDALDMESFNGLSSAAICQWKMTAALTLQRLTRRPVIEYSSPGLYPGCATNGDLEWIADWGVSIPANFGGWSTWVDWQYSAPAFAGGTLAGMDRDRANGLLRLAYRPPAPKPKPRPPVHRLTPTDRRLIAYWTTERRRVLRSYHADGCTWRSTTPTCKRLRAREHVLFRDIRGRQRR